MRAFAIFVALLLACRLASAQPGFQLRGVVMSETRQLVTATIQIAGTPGTITSNAFGEFLLVRSSRDSVSLAVFAEGWMPKMLWAHPGRDSLLRIILVKPGLSREGIDSLVLRGGVNAAFVHDVTGPAGMDRFRVMLASKQEFNHGGGLAVSVVRDSQRVLLYVTHSLHSKGIQTTDVWGAPATWSADLGPPVSTVIVVVNAQSATFELLDHRCVRATGSDVTTLIAGAYPVPLPARPEVSKVPELIGFPAERLPTCR